ncbi:hypothetical protein Q8A73_010514 [Channa argus]|nr:hypothetical protein Q8A73_010514 [Channa argus]
MMGQLDMLPGQQQRGQEKPGEGPLQTSQHRANNSGQQRWMEQDNQLSANHQLGAGSDQRNEVVLLLGRGEVCMHYEQEEEEEEEEEEAKASSKSSSV